MLHEKTNSDAGSTLDFAKSPHERVYLALSTLKAQHGALVRSMSTLAPPDGNTPSHGSPLPSTAEEEESGSEEAATRLSTSQLKQSRHTSISTTVSDLSEWFDALDGINEGAQEFVMDVQTPTDGNEQPSQLLNNDSHSTLEHATNSSVDTEAEAIQEDEINSKDGRNEIPHNPAQSSRRTQLPAHTSGDEGSLFAILKKNVGKVRTHRVLVNSFPNM